MIQIGNFIGEKMNTTTRVIEVDGSGPYGGDWKVGDLVKQSNIETQAKIREILGSYNVKIIGEPEVIMTSYSGL